MTWLVTSAILGASAVMAGAFGAHGLVAKVDPSKLEAWKTAAIYHLVHAVVLLALALYARATGKGITVPASLFTLGSLFFAGSIYLLVLTGQKWLGPITPLGGLLLIAGWLSLIVCLKT